jgi:hypothetical protein
MWATSAIFKKHPDQTTYVTLVTLRQGDHKHLHIYSGTRVTINIYIQWNQGDHKHLYTVEPG